MEVSPVTKLSCFLVIILVQMNIVLCLYEDQIGKSDWRIQQIGKPIFTFVDPTSRRIFLATEENVVAALNPRNGNIVWRQVLEGGSTGRISALGNTPTGEIISVSGDEFLYLRSWDSLTGSLNWEISGNSSDGPNEFCFDDDFTSIFVVSKKQSFIDVREIGFKEQTVKEKFRINAHWLTPYTTCQCLSGGRLLCVDNSNRKLQVVHLKPNSDPYDIDYSDFDISDNESVELDLSHNLGTNDLFVLKSLNSDHSYLCRLNEYNKVAIKQKVLHTTRLLAVAENGNDVLINVDAVSDQKNTFKVSAFDLKSLTTRGEIQTDSFRVYTPHGAIVHLNGYIFAKRDGGLALRLLVVTKDGLVVLAQVPDKVVWEREEGLARIIGVESVDLPLNANDAEYGEDFIKYLNADILGKFAKRVYSQLSLMARAVLSLQNLRLEEVTRYFNPVDTDASGGRTNEPIFLFRDQFGLRRIIVAVTEEGKVFGIDHKSGQIIWKIYQPELVGYTLTNGKRQISMYLQRSSLHLPHQPQLVLLGKNEENGNGVLFVLNPVTGVPIGPTGVLPLKFRVSQALMHTELADDHFVKPLIMLSNTNEVHVFPKSSFSIVHKNAGSIFFFTAETSSGLIQGFSLVAPSIARLQANPLWSIHIPSSQEITNVVAKPAAERVHSQGRVMTDRSVTYKYVNPNLVAIISRSKSLENSAITIYLLDVVTGATVYSVVHRKAKEPVFVAHSENWVVYTFQSERNRRTELVVLELYEGKNQANSTAFSSLSQRPGLPYVESQSYVYPAHVDAIGFTVTEKGITSKHLILALPSGNLAELPKAIVDPRRVLQPTVEMREEGILPYIPELPIMAESMINYNQTLANIRGIYTAPTGLESTCLIFAYGLDLFGTRSAPSNTFDILKDNFNHSLIVVVLLGLIGASVFTKRLASWRAINQAWK